MSATPGHYRFSALSLPAAILLLLLQGCAGKEVQEETAPPTPAEPDYARGARLYHNHCAACHDPGHDADAPTLDDIEAWDERAFQWESVVKQHAAQGFLAMPAQGGEAGLSEENINDVLFFMLTQIRALDE